MKTHIFGELDLDLSKGPGKIWDQAFDISEQCGYMIHLTDKGGQIIIEGTDNDVATLTFENGKVKTVHHYATNDEGDIISPVREVKI